jgi:D-alanyl-lipoteichoic acid acyltransferase DltB (MBOAT superfamily)
VELCKNFNHPYLSQSPGEFWRRWHMSLSTWFRDYVYIPLGGSRAGQGKMIFNLVLTFFLSGLWHGASWNFIIWGTYHGILVALWPLLAKRVPLLADNGGAFGTVLRVGLTFVLMHIGWLLFREHSVAMLTQSLALNPFDAPASDWRMGAALAIEAVLYGLPLMVVLPLLQKFGALIPVEDERLKTWSWTLLQGAAAAVCIYGVAAYRCSVGSDFIYFQF